MEELVDIEGLPVKLIDTAGMRITDDEVEKHGVDRARAALESADLIFWLISPPVADIETDFTVINELECENLLLIAGKDDLAESDMIRTRITDRFPQLPLLTFSAVSGDGLETVRSAIVDRYNQAGSSTSEEVLVTNSRHQASLLNSSRLLEDAATAITAGITLDLVATLLRGSAEALAELTGDSVSEQLIETIFSRFCVGK